jgi:NADH-quinone oxidoreductase subunit G
VNAEGRPQSFYAAVNTPGETRPAWKVLRVLGSALGVPDFGFDTIDQVRAACMGGRNIGSLLSNQISSMEQRSGEKANGIQRIADVPIYFADPLVRRSAPLQATKDAEPPRAWMNGRLMGRLALAEGDSVLIRQAEGQATLKAALDERLPDECVRVAAAHRSTAGLGPMFGTVTLEKVRMEKVA